MEHDQAEILAELAVVALLGLFQPRQVRVELLLREEGRPVHPLHGLILRVALPVGVRRRQQLERLQPADRRHVRADAEVEKGAFDVVGRHHVAAFFLDQLHLERLAAVGEERLGVGLRHHHPLERAVLGGNRLHPRFNPRQILRHERLLDHEIVEEALVRRRTDAALRLRELGQHRRGQQMRRAVAVDRQRVRDPSSVMTRTLASLVQRRGEIDQTVVDHPRECLASQPR